MIGGMRWNCSETSRKMWKKIPKYFFFKKYSLSWERLLLHWTPEGWEGAAPPFVQHHSSRTESLDAKLAEKQNKRVEEEGINCEVYWHPGSSLRGSWDGLPESNRIHLSPFDSSVSVRGHQDDPWVSALVVGGDRGCVPHSTHLLSLWASLYTRNGTL